MNDGWEGFYLQRQGMEEEVFLAARYESTWQVWEAISRYNVARVARACSFHSFNTSTAILFSLLLWSANSVTKQWPGQLWLNHPQFQIGGLWTNEVYFKVVHSWAEYGHLAALRGETLPTALSRELWKYNSILKAFSGTRIRGCQMRHDVSLPRTLNKGFSAVADEESGFWRMPACASQS